jgi:Clp amino terminal domain, pathogenicity island component
MFERFDEPARRVVEAAVGAARERGDSAVLTQHLLFALATADAVTGRLLAEAAGGADLSGVVLAGRGRRPGEADHERLLATLGIDLAEIRHRAEDTFGVDALAHAAATARPSRLRRPIWTRVSCSSPMRRPECHSPLAGQQIAMIGRVKKILDRATRAARPGLAAPSHVLLALVTDDEPACELLADFGVDLDALAEATRRSLRADGTAQDRAS